MRVPAWLVIVMALGAYEFSTSMTIYYGVRPMLEPLHKIASLYALKIRHV